MKILAGHGKWDGKSVFKIPSGKTIHFVVRHGFAYIDIKEWSEQFKKYRKKEFKNEKALFQIMKQRTVETKYPGEWCFDYFLYPPKGITTYHTGHNYIRQITKKENKLKLSDLISLKKYNKINEFFWLACRAFKGASMTTIATPNDLVESKSYGILIQNLYDYSEKKGRDWEVTIE